MSLEYRVGDVFDRLAEIPDGSIDLIVTSPPFLALRSYLPADHPDKGKEIGSEATPADFLDTLLALSAEWGRVLAPHGSLCVELGDTYSGSSSGGGDYDPTRESAGITYTRGVAPQQRHGWHGSRDGWPLAKSLTGIPTLYPWSLAYNRNLLTGQPSPAGQWRIRNLIVWARPNPPVGALGDKFRPATSYITVACRGVKRYFDLDAVRTDSDRLNEMGGGFANRTPAFPGETRNGERHGASNPAGAPPLDWHTDHHPEDGDWLWKMSTQPFSGKAQTYRWERVEADAPGDDTRRIASPDCLRHGDLPGQVPKALRDAHAADRSSRNGHTDDHLASTQAADSPPTFWHSDQMVVDAALAARAARRRSTSSNKTDPDPATTPADTPSAQTAVGTARTPASHESSVPDLDTPESSTGSDDCPANREPQTSPDTADIPRSERPCTCSFERRVVESTSHYATFPMALPKRLIEAMCPLRVCTVCGRPSERIVGDAEYVKNGAVVTPHVWQSGIADAGAHSNKQDGNTTRNAPTLGWSDCGHNQWRTGIVLDCFAGSGTTLDAAQAVGRHAIGIDLDPRNADLARDRVGMFLEVVA